MIDDDGLPVGSHFSGDPLPGATRAWERLGVGYRCETWLAWSDALWAPVVVKFPRPHQLGHPRARRSLQREVAALAGNLHPGLPRLYSDGTDAARPHIVEEYLDGPALDDEIDERGALGALDVALLAAQLLAALRSVHARGLAHIDLKPANIVLRDARPVVLDFGSARAIGAPQPAGKLIGSPGYAAPELEAGEPISASMDVFGVGVILHEALTGKITFEPELAARDRPAPVPPPTSAVAAVAIEMLDPDPGARPDVDVALRSFGALASELRRPVWPDWV
jgi:eukaryotic-like serine/threonine-protein kinase